MPHQKTFSRPETKSKAIANMSSSSDDVKAISDHRPASNLIHRLKAKIDKKSSPLSFNPEPAQNSRQLSPIQAVFIKGIEMGEMQAAYKYFKKDQADIAIVLKEYEKEKFDSAEAFINKVLHDHPELKEKADQQYVAEEKEQDRLAAIDEKWKKVASEMGPAKDLIAPAIFTHESISHAFERHTVPGIIHVKELKSATPGAIAVFPEEFEIKEIVGLVEKAGDLKWTARGSGGAVQADVQITGDITVRVYANDIFGKVMVETFFPLGAKYAMKREAATALYEKK